MFLLASMLPASPQYNLSCLRPHWVNQSLRGNHNGYHKVCIQRTTSWSQFIFPAYLPPFQMHTLFFNYISNVGWIMGLQRCLHTNPQNLDTADMIKLSIEMGRLSWIIQMGPSVITIVLIRGDRSSGTGEGRQCDNKSRHWSDTAMNQGMPTVSRNWKRQITYSFLEPSEVTSPDNILI